MLAINMLELNQKKYSSISVIALECVMNISENCFSNTEWDLKLSRKHQWEI